MNQRQKEVQQIYLNNEKACLEALKDTYQGALDDINGKIAELLGRNDADLQHVIYQVEYQKALKKQVEGILDQLHTQNFDTISQYLSNCYEEGFLGTMYDLQGQGIPLMIPIDQEQVVDAVMHDTKLSESLYSSLGKDVATLKKNVASEISRGISQGAMYGEIAKNVSRYAGVSQNSAMRIARTEGHRIQCTASMNACEKAKSKGADIVKQWDATLDGKTRDSHRQVDGEIKELEEKFSNGMMFPSDPNGGASEVVNCRCALLQRARWAVNQPFTKWSEDAPILIDDDGTTQFVQFDSAKDYKQFKEQYWQASEKVTDNVQKIEKQEITHSDIQKAKNKIADNDVDIKTLKTKMKQEETNLLFASDAESMNEAKKSYDSFKSQIKKLENENIELKKKYNIPQNAKESFAEQKVDVSKLTQSLTAEEESAFSSWTRNEYLQINQYLRTESKGGISPIAIQDANIMEKALDRCIVKEDIVVKRGTDSNALNHLFGSDAWKDDDFIASGKIIKDKGFVATTPIESGGFGGIQMYIDVPKGAKGVYIGDISSAPDEKEFLLQCGTKFEVVDIIKTKDVVGDLNYELYLKVIVNE